jgi:hypothetical protein
VSPMAMTPNGNPHPDGTWVRIVIMSMMSYMI